MIKIGKIKCVKVGKSLQPRSIHHCLPVMSVNEIVAMRVSMMEMIRSMMMVMMGTWVATRRPSPLNKLTSTPSTMTITSTKLLSTDSQ